VRPCKKGSEFSSANGSYAFGLLLRAQPAFETTVEARVYEASTGIEVTDQIQMDPVSVKFQPTQEG